MTAWSVFTRCEHSWPQPAQLPSQRNYYAGQSKEKQDNQLFISCTIVEPFRKCSLIQHQVFLLPSIKPCSHQKSLKSMFAVFASVMIVIGPIVVMILEGENGADGCCRPEHLLRNTRVCGHGGPSGHGDSTTVASQRKLFTTKLC